MKGKLIGGMIFMISLLLLGSCSCPDEEVIYKNNFKYKVGQFVHHRVSEDKVLIIDTMRYYDCSSDTDVELMYRGINSAENENVYTEIELKP
jgi:hypothetical protein